MKINFAVVGHRSEQFRPQGTECVNIFVDSLYKSFKSDFDVVFVDNQSEPPFKDDDIFKLNKETFEREHASLKIQYNNLEVEYVSREPQYKY